MRYFDIIPLTKISRKKPQFFTYAASENLSVGTLVEISFGRKKLQGVIFRKTKLPKFKIKEISKVVQSDFLTPKQIDLARQISAYYITSLGLVLKQFVPKITKKQTPCFLIEEEIKTKAPKLTTAQQEVLDKIAKEKESAKPFLLFGPASSGKTEVIMQVVERMVQEKKQSLLVIPEIFLSQQEIKRYKDRFPQQKIIFFHSKLKQSEVTFALEEIRKGAVDLVISTRIGLFLPFKNLGLLALDEEQDFSHKQWDQTPRYHARIVAEMLTKIHRSTTLLVSSTPSIESVSKSQKKRYTLLELPRLKTGAIEIKKPAIEFVDLKEMYAKKGTIPISETLKGCIRTTLKDKQTTLILVPKRGKSRLVYCTDCKKKLMCPNCNLPLIHEQTSYKCQHCSFKTSSPTSCPNCRSFRLKEFGFGTEGVVELLKKDFANANIQFIDNTLSEKPRARKKLFQDLQNGKVDILVGTYAIVKGFDLPNIGLVTTINADNWSGQTDFRFDERWLANLFQLSGRLNRVNSKQTGRCIIQTYNPENELLEYLKKQDWLGFAEEELETREFFNYPPFSFIIRLTLKQANKDTLSKKATKVYNELLRNLNNTKTSVQFPYFGTLKKVRGKWEKHILIKTNDFTSDVWQRISRLTPDEWIIDVDSESIF